MDYKLKYLKYKQKYISLKHKMHGGDEIILPLNKYKTNITNLISQIPKTINDLYNFVKTDIINNEVFINDLVIYAYFMLKNNDEISLLDLDYDSKLKYFNEFDKKVHDIMSSISSNSIVICPGDSPTKFYNYIKLCYSNKLLDNNISLLIFPLSGVKENTTSVDIINHMLKYNYNINNINKNNIYFMDFINTENTFKPFQELFPNIIKISLLDYTKDLKMSDHYFFNTSNKERSRCVPSHTINSNVSHIQNFEICIVFLLLAYLNNIQQTLFFDKLKEFTFYLNNTKPLYPRDYNNYYIGIFFDPSKLLKEKKPEKIKSNDIIYINQIEWLDQGNLTNIKKNIYGYHTDKSTITLYNPDGGLFNTITHINITQIINISINNTSVENTKEN